VTEVLLYTDDAGAASAEIDGAGGRVLHVLTPSVLVADVPAAALLSTCRAEPPTDLDPASADAAAAWSASRAKPRAPEWIPWDSPGFEAPG
jgi:hypothetical protein